MPLTASRLEQELRSVIDTDFTGFVAYDPPTIEEAASRWARALDN